MRASARPARARRSIEIVPAREHVSRPAAVAEIDGDDGIDRLAADGVILAHADPAATALIDHPGGSGVSGCGSDAPAICR